MFSLFFLQQPIDFVMYDIFFLYTQSVIMCNTHFHWKFSQVILLHYRNRLTLLNNDLKLWRCIMFSLFFLQQPIDFVMYDIFFLYTQSVIMCNTHFHWKFSQVILLH